MHPDLRQLFRQRESLQTHLADLCNQIDDIRRDLEQLETEIATYPPPEPEPEPEDDGEIIMF